MPITELLIRPQTIAVYLSGASEQEPVADENIRLDLRARDLVHGATTSANQLVWEAFLGSDYIGYAALEFAPHEFDLSLTQYGPAFRFYIAPKFRFRGLGSIVAQAFIAQLRGSGFSRPLLASHSVCNESAAHILSQCGFLYTGCRTVGAGGEDHLQMVVFL